MEDQAPYESNRSDMWRKKRIGKFTASEIWKLMGEPRSKEAKERGDLSDTAKTYILDRLAERLTGMSKDFVNDATVWGIEKEDMARTIYQRMTALRVTETDFIEYSSMAGGTPDGLVGDMGLIEIKCPWNTTEHLKHCLLIKDDLSLKKNFPAYYWQMMSNILFTGRQWCDFISFDPRIERSEGIFIFRLEANDEDMQVIETMIQRAVVQLNVYRKIISDHCNILADASND